MKNTKRKTFLEYLNKSISEYPSNRNLSVGMLQDMVCDAIYHQNLDIHKEFEAMNLYEYKEELDSNSLLNDAKIIFIHLVAYGIIGTVKDIEYPNGTHKEFIERARNWIINYDVYKNNETLKKIKQ